MTTSTDSPSDAQPLPSPEPSSGSGSGSGSVVPPGRALGTWIALVLVLVVALSGLVSSVLLWQKLSRMQEQLAQQSASTGAQALEAKTWAKQAQEAVQNSVARVSLMEARLSAVALQRTQLEELMHSLSRSRDETLVVDIESTLRIAQQQALMTGSSEPLVTALQSAQKRVERAAQPRLTPVSRALQKDLERLNSLPSFDLPGLLVLLDEGVTLVDGLSFANEVLVTQRQMRQQAEAAGEPAAALTWWMASLMRIGDEVKSLLRVSRIDTPEASLLSPEQAFFVRENLKLKLLNARLGLLARQNDGVRADLSSAAVLVTRYAEPQSRRTVQLLELLKQTSTQVRTIEPPRIEGSLAALNTAAAGR